MDLADFLLHVYCTVDDALSPLLAGQKLRQRGPQPTLADSEVLTMLVAGEFLGLEHDHALYRYFRWHHRAAFPRLATVDRTTFTRQAANLAGVSAALWTALTRELVATGAVDPALPIVDSLPVPICRAARAGRCRRFRGEASFGMDPMAKRFFLGFRLHVRLAWPGVITAAALAPAHESDRALLPQLLEAEDGRVGAGWTLGDRGYWSPALRAAYAPRGRWLLAPAPKRATDPAPWPRWLVSTRRRVETVLSQLAERFHFPRVWARDRWHLVARCTRKLLSHTVAALLCHRAGLPLLTFNRLLTD